MAERTYKERTYRPEHRRQEEETANAIGKVATDGEKLKGDLDALIDEIDEALEENAEEFVKSYVQKGGE